jgi:ABC-type sugar transport system, permease component
MKPARKPSSPIPAAVYFLVLAALALLTLLPIVVLFANATRSTEQISQSLSLLPGGALRHNYQVLSSRGTFNVVRGFCNSMLVSMGFTFLSIYFGTMAAYGLHVYRFRGRDALFLVVLGVIMIPAQLTTIGYYKLMAAVGLTNNLVSLILPGLCLPTTVFFLKQYMSQTISFDLLAAARIDGASESRIFHQVFLPLVSPAMATMAIFAFVSSWNNFMLPNILLTNSAKYTLPLMVQLLKGEAFRVEYGALYLGIALSVLPIIAMYLVFSRFILEGVTRGAVVE